MLRCDTYQNWLIFAMASTNTMEPLRRIIVDSDDGKEVDVTTTFTNSGIPCSGKDGSDNNTPSSVPVPRSVGATGSSSNTTTMTNAVDTTSTPPELTHDAYRIVLYYCYIPLSETNMMDLINFHTIVATPQHKSSSCSESSSSESNSRSSSVGCDVLGGRVRIASEGLNGVLSGTIVDLQQYETQLRDIVYRILEHTKEGTQHHHNAPDTWEQLLDVKYCPLRTDLNIACQLFTKLQVQRTDTVVGLFDKDMICNNSNRTVHQDQCDNNHDDDDDNEKVDINSRRITCCDNNAIEATLLSTQPYRRRNQSRRKQLHHHQHQPDHHRQRQNLERIRTIYYEALYHDEMDSPEPSAPRIVTVDGCCAPHLSPDEWNTKLHDLVRQNQQVNNDNMSTRTTSTTTTKSSNPHNIVLLDCRNCYESAIGYFEVPGTTTVLTNTRKYSELPYVLMDQISDIESTTIGNAAIASSTTTTTVSALRNASHIFMYCTGGVRCERASVFLHAALMTSSSSSPSQPPLPEIYQLHGGIQRYLEQYHNQQKWHDPNADSTLSKYYYKGKNFVFDLRRTDPMTIGDACTGKDTVVGQCIVCHAPYDDYDHGHAPILHHETRCYKCRILILVCPNCRTDVLCWGDDIVVSIKSSSSSIKSSSSTTKDDALTPTISTKKKLYCGGVEPRECLYIPPVQEMYVSEV